MEYSYSDYQEMVKAIRTKTDFAPAVGIVLGSGLGQFVSRVKVKAIIPYSGIPSMPVSTNANHAGCFVFGYYDDIPVVLMQGRLHLYEGYSAQQVVVPIRIMGLLGIKYLVITNAAGGINTSFKPGDLMLLDDQITCLVESPLRGPNIEEFGTRFPDMSNIYDHKLTYKIYEKSQKENLPIQKGVYMQFYGPQYESKAEIRMARTLGADSCGMSTTGEAIASVSMGIKTVGFSLITNMACGITDQKLSDDEVIEIGKRSQDETAKLMNIIMEVIRDDQ